MDIHLNCPIPFTDSDRVLLAHGGGGRMTHQLISQVFYPAFRNPLLEQDHDGCVFPMEEGRLAYSTDSFVVDPIFFPGGDIGDLAINGTVNDLACCGARCRASSSISMMGFCWAVFSLSSVLTFLLPKR